MKKLIWSQTIGGLVFGFFAGEPLIILLSTAPLALYIKVIYGIAASNHVDFLSMYAWTGLWTCIFLIIFSVTNASVLMKFSTRYFKFYLFLNFIYFLFLLFSFIFIFIFIFIFYFYFFIYFLFIYFYFLFFIIFIYFILFFIYLCLFI